MRRASFLFLFASAALLAPGCSDDAAAPPTTPTSTVAPSPPTPEPSATAIPSRTATATLTPPAAATATGIAVPTATELPAHTATATPTVDAAALAAAGEVAFFETLSGESNREADCISLLSAATAANPTDGRSFFLLGMMHLYRAGQGLTDYDDPSAFVLEESGLAGAALDSAVPLSTADRRVPGFRGAATYLNGVLQKSPEILQLGLAQLRDAIELYPDFNNFSFLGAVAPVVSRTDPLFVESLDLVRGAIASGCSPFTQPDICGNGGKAPHNVQGAMTLFGDMYAKAGDASAAVTYYSIALNFTDSDTWPFRPIAAERLANVNDLVARWADADPDNDPPFVGRGPEACAVCHYK